MSIDHVDPFEFDFLNTKLRAFFKSRNMVECFEQNKRTILAACEDVQNMGSFECRGELWPLPQTNQMNLEHVILNNPTVPGIFCITTSYRFEKNPVEGRHNTIFPMIEFEIPGGFDSLIEFEKDMLEYLGFGSKNSYPEGDYMDICKKYGVDELTHEHETQLYKDYGPVFFLKNFPEGTSPFWNMQRDTETGLAKKIDVIICGTETIGSASRENNIEVMRNRFHTISDGEYAGLLYSTFGKDRVEKELDEYLAHTFFDRSGAGVGVTRMLAAMRALKLFQ